MTCEQCGNPATQMDDEYQALCDRCALRQEERSAYGYGLAASTYGFLSEEE